MEWVEEEEDVIADEVVEIADDEGEDIADIWLRCEWCGEIGLTETIKTAGSTEARMKERCIDRDSCRDTVLQKMGRTAHPAATRAVWS